MTLSNEIKNPSKLKTRIYFFASYYITSDWNSQKDLSDTMAASLINLIIEYKLFLAYSLNTIQTVNCKLCFLFEKVILK